MKTICVLNQKGGVGKTTTALNVGLELAQQNNHVLFVDLDAQSNLTYCLGIDDEQELTAFDVLTEKAPVKEVSQDIYNFALVPASILLSGSDLSLTGKRKEYRLKEALSEVSGLYDYCIIDTPPVLGILTVSALTASNCCIIPCQGDIFSIIGLTQLINTIETVQGTTNKRLEVAGIVLTRFNPRTILAREAADYLDDIASTLNSKVFDTKIRECNAIKEAQINQTSLYECAPRSNATMDYRNLVKEIIK